MAAIDPSAAPKAKKNSDLPPRATLKIIFDPEGPDSEDEDDEEDMDDEQLGLMGEDEDESSSDDEDTNGGPSDPAKSKKARREAAAEQIKKALEKNDPDSDEEMDVDSLPKTNGLVSKKKKGKAKASEKDEESESDDGDDEEPSLGVEELVLCTLDGNKVYDNDSTLVPLLTSRTELPTTIGHCDRRGSNSVFQSIRGLRCVPHRQLHSGFFRKQHSSRL